MSYSSARLFNRATPPHIVTLVLLAGVSAMNMSIFLPSLPVMTQAFDTEYGVMQLSISLYLAFTAALQIIIGPLSDRFGRRPIVLGALAIFAMASLGCYLSTTIEMFLTFRMIAASVAVGMVMSRTIVRDVVPMAEAASMIGYVTMGMSLVPMFAPTIGGFIDEIFGWRAIFLFTFAAGTGLTLLCWADQGETNQAKSVSFMAQIKDYPELFTSPRFWGYALSAAFASGAFFAFLGGSPYVASVVYELPSTTTRYLFGVPAVGYFVGNLISGRYSVSIGVNRMILIGSLLLVFGMAASLFVTAIGYGSAFTFFAFCTFVGLGNGMVLPNATAGLLSVRPHLAGTASGVGGAIMIGGGAALAALSGTLLEHGHGSYPLQWVMLLSAVASLVSVLLVLRREKAVRRA
ncbi:MFS transporter, DHA1 family, bicyclomycin/chloramphenicol resistance protein [Litoreibacter ascidiaceicola]|uniref:Bcr/CflA family efflux transporter n=1 Tax=Litoreibacter ascidiaceicola TaxID=1486859 RepID=A0A1M4TX47_9RHOB|nr:multidrug effflux MFS transporter [Litoreibacter ascidiaceicola]SHE49012.1 MFS transporter, DHA1 family, bicyclomycin/chloramphenicol resistance protein [Litoreibacter ascidiaceicola]